MKSNKTIHKKESYEFSRTYDFFIQPKNCKAIDFVVQLFTYI